MKYRFFILIAFLLSLLLYNNFSLRLTLRDNRYAQTRVFYSQTSQSDEEVVKTIQSADKFVYFAIYTLTRQNIADALVAAKLRGLDVEGVMDFNQSIISQEKPLVKELQKYNIKIKIPFKESGLMHIKLLVTDKAYASGSFNWTTSAAKYNDEVLEIGSVEGIREQYLKIWRTLFNRY
jgi:phosphatidylserine/phosphatidylglycerophosphate/cardiolipin synthase-like enzyme